MTETLVELILGLFHHLSPRHAVIAGANFRQSPHWQKNTERVGDNEKLTEGETMGLRRVR